MLRLQTSKLVGIGRVYRKYVVSESWMAVGWCQHRAVASGLSCRICTLWIFYLRWSLCQSLTYRWVNTLPACQSLTYRWVNTLPAHCGYSTSDDHSVRVLHTGEWIHCRPADMKQASSVVSRLTFSSLSHCDYKEICHVSEDCWADLCVAAVKTVRI